MMVQIGGSRGISQPLFLRMEAPFIVDNVPFSKTCRIQLGFYYFWQISTAKFSLVRKSKVSHAITSAPNKHTKELGWKKCGSDDCCIYMCDYAYIHICIFLSYIPN